MSLKFIGKISNKKASQKYYLSWSITPFSYCLKQVGIFSEFWKSVKKWILQYSHPFWNMCNARTSFKPRMDHHSLVRLDSWFDCQNWSCVEYIEHPNSKSLCTGWVICFSTVTLLRFWSFPKLSTHPVKTFFCSL